MTQIHRDDFLAAEVWQKTEYGYLRVERFSAVPDGPFLPAGVRFYVTSFQMRKPIKFRRFPFGKNPNLDALNGWFVLRSEEDMVNFGGLKELNEMAARDAKNNVAEMEVSRNA